MAYNYMYERCPKITYIYIYIDWTQNFNSVHCKFIISLRSMTFCQTIPQKLKLFFSSFFDIALLVEFMIKYAFILLI